MRYIALLLIGLLASPSYALTQVDIFSAEVAINAENKQPEQVARNTGMEQVLIRATGQTDVASNETIQKAMRKSSQYMSQMSFGESNDQSTLRMRFNGAQIRSLLTQAQLPYWPDTRSNILVWLVEEQNYDKNIVWEHSNSQLAAGLQANAKERGLPLTLPVGDFDDITGIATSDLWGSFVTPISKASQRYPVDAVLVIKAQSSGLRWTLYDQKPNQLTSAPKSPVSGSVSGNSATTSKKLVDQISNYYASKSAVTVASESSESILTQFISLNNAQDFFHLESALKRLNSVASLDILKIQNNEVTFRIHLLSTQQEFEQEVESIRQVAKVEESYIEPEVSPEFETQDNSMSVGDDSTDAVDAEGSETDSNVQVIKGSELSTDAELTSTSDVTLDESGGEELTVTAPVHAKPSLVYEWVRS
ncbi:DUF2066 domain-containing protein [Vibrio lentus]|uniref:DUF2066 domain-containing protein n=1 Tax=Vibrio lentus TaxID=136468 RepID=A0AA44VP13_9VIBR|nr:DUF2066 domain-containing protein [Vibrio lentus]MCB5359385.1 DUF2066 domain-containing protein [Vibrio lentus]MCB5449852.1 DUF2066 domain-containing protein [Vibrio lentus]MCB5461769.1 DUF2066 domain-containing protein [Vibrio lentus]MCC4793253.1 DUF2066 domain-containing protein [Vibrio lentus]MCC4849335.1 DUF2066 domain-containing protein [Vibrio lentus]